MFNMESRHLLNLSVQNALDCISENFNLKNFPGGACARNSLEKCATRSPHGRYCVHIATVYYISRSPLSQNPPVAPYLSPGFFIFFSRRLIASTASVWNDIDLVPLILWGWRTCSHTLQITTNRGMVLVVRPMANELFSKETCHVPSERLDSIPSNVCPCYARVPKLKLMWGWFNGTWRCLWGVYEQFAHLAKRYHVSGFTSWCSLFFTARRREKYDTLPEDLHCWSQLATACQDNPDWPAQELITTAALLHRSTTNFIPIDHLSAPNVGNLVMGFLSRIYRLREKSRVAKGHELPRVVWRHPPQEVFLKWICAEMQSGAFWETILRNVIVAFISLFIRDHVQTDTILYVPCHIVSLDKNTYLMCTGRVASGWFFRYTYL